MSKKHILVIVFVFLGAALLVGAAFAKNKDVFEGAWYGDDIYEGTHMWMWITNHFGVYEMLWYDDGCGACYQFGNGPSCLIVASGHKSGPNTLSVDGGNLYCYWDEGVELLEGWDFTAVQTYDPESDTIHQIYNQHFLTDWTRTNNRPPNKVIDPKPFPKP